MNTNINVENITIKTVEARTKLIRLVNSFDLPVAVIDGVLSGVLADIKSQELLAERNEFIQQVQKEIAEQYISKKEIERLKAEGKLIEVEDVRVERYKEDDGNTEGVANEQPKE